MFRGVANLSLDAKGRMAMPARYRDQLMACCGGKLIVTLDRDGCLLIYPLPNWEVIENELMKLPSMNPAVRAIQRLLLGHATECELDGQGRLLIPGPLRQVAGLGRQIVLIGQGNKFELWDEAAWAAQREQWMNEGSASEQFNEALASLSI
ncbi:MAG TPA: transcriptional regulator MraZ [Chromatiales bacterium]|nr:transcriptional regulator MraZ [Chromatiales bacterium]